MTNPNPNPNPNQPYGTCPVCGLPLIYSPKRQLLICGDEMCKYCTPFTETHAETTNNLLASRFLADCAIEEKYPQYRRGSEDRSTSLPHTNTSAKN